MANSGVGCEAVCLINGQRLAKGANQDQLFVCRLPTVECLQAVAAHREPQPRVQSLQRSSADCSWSSSSITAGPYPNLRQTEACRWTACQCSSKTTSRFLPTFLPRTKSGSAWYSSCSIALEKARVKPEEAVHVGDQYKLDVMGARGVGITPILIDRYDVYPKVSDCPRIQSLSQLAEYL